MQTPRVLVTAALLLACAPKSADTGGESDASSAATDVTDATTAIPTSGTDPTKPDATTLPPDTAGSADGSATASPTSTSTSTGTSGPTTTTTDTGDEPGGGGLPGACMTVCTHFDMCSPGSAGPVETCTQGCVAGTEVPSPCAMALAAQWNCVAALPCDEALKFLDGEPSSCLAELKHADEVCQDVGCNGEIGGGDDFCELEQDCGGGTQNYHCDIEANLCTCTENDVAGAQCPADGFCAQGPDDQRAAITACCGWVWK